MNRRDLSGARRRRRAARRRQVFRSRLLLLAGAAAAVFLLTGAGRAMDTLASSPADTQPPAPTADAAPPLLTPSPAPASDGDWRLVLVNPWTPLSEQPDLTLTKLKNGRSVDSRCYPALQRMMDDCRAAGLSPVICSAYRSQEAQAQLFDQKVAALTARGLSPEEARTEAGKSVAVPGTSEHQLGLAVDIVDFENQNLDESQERTAVQKWLLESCWKYGFILRYPSGKSDLTGILYEPWHYRYVGEDAAREITEAGICLEEYLAQGGRA